MAKAKLILTPNPTFKARVPVPVPGGGTTDVEFTFKRRSREKFKDFMEALKDKEDVDLVMDMASGWELEDAFDETSVGLLCEEYIGAPMAILETYIREQTGATGRTKN